MHPRFEPVRNVSRPKRFGGRNLVMDNFDIIFNGMFLLVAVIMVFSVIFGIAYSFWFVDNCMDVPVTELKGGCFLPLVNAGR